MFFKLHNIIISDLLAIEDKDIIAFIVIIMLHGYENTMDINDILAFGFSKTQINNIIKSLNVYFKVSKNNNTYILYKPTTNDIDNEKNMLYNFWGININNINECYNTLEPLKKLSYELFLIRKHLPQININIIDDEISNLELYYQNVLAGDIINKYNITLSKNDIYVINKWLCETTLPLAVFKFCFVQSILQNKYHNFRSNFFDKIISTYDKMHIKSIKQAVVFQKQRNEYLQENSKTYIKPTYQASNHDVKLSSDALAKLKEELYE